MSTNNAINNGGVITTVYSTPGTYTWSVNSRTRLVTVAIWGGGGGGASGRKGTIAVSGGGSGGGAGSCTIASFPATFFNSTATVVVGAGGNGGNAQSTDGTNGNVGIAGALSSFGNLTAAGGSAGVAGTTSGGTAAAVIPTQTFISDSSTPTNYMATPTGGPGGNGAVNATTGATALSVPSGTGIFISYIGTGGGGGSGSHAATDTLGGSGGNVN